MAPAVDAAKAVRVYDPWTTLLAIGLLRAF
jgi:hypothetical protein